MTIPEVTRMTATRAGTEARPYGVKSS
jgi:hypothetical protein